MRKCDRCRDYICLNCGRNSLDCIRKLCRFESGGKIEKEEGREIKRKLKRSENWKWFWNKHGGNDEE